MHFIHIGMSTRGNDLNSELVRWIIAQTHKKDIACRLFLSKSNTSAVKAQSGLFKMMYESDMKFDYALFMDTDVCPPEGTIEKLIATGKDVVTAPIWHYDETHKDVHINVHYTFDNIMADRIHIPGKGVEKILSASFSCLLVARKVFDAFYNAGEDPILWSPMLEERWKGKENDIIFFLKLRKLGIPAYVCWDAGGGTHYRNIALCDETINNMIRNMAHEVQR